MNNKIKCPYCNREFAPDEIQKHQIEAEVSLLLEEKHKKEIEEVRLSTEKSLREKIENEKNLEVQDLKKTLQEKDEKINDFREKELELREKSRKLEEKDIELEKQRRIGEEKKKVEENTSKRLADEHRFKDMEKDKQMSDMRKQIEDLKRISQQNSMQTQGEVGEIDLENTLKSLFPSDEIYEVKKGEQGGDIRQTVKSIRGTICGLILWERKITKAWDEKWTKKLKEDMRRDKVHLGVIVTEAMPKDFKKTIGERNGIWLTTSEFVEPLASLLRKNLYDVAKEQAIKLNKQSKAEELYDFVTGNDFVQQVERMVEIYLEMKLQVSRERSSFEKLWKQRELQVDGLLKGVSGIYGGMQLIAGSALPHVKNLELESGE